MLRCVVLCTLVAVVVCSPALRRYNIAAPGEEPHYSIIEPIDIDHENDDVSFLETETTGEHHCMSTGDTHTQPFWTGGYTDMMGTTEWIAVEGPSGVTGTPHWIVQFTQRVWQDCGNSNVHITVLKDAAFKCGDFSLVYKVPKYTHNCYNRASNYGLGGFNNNNRQVAIQMYIVGTDDAGNEWDGHDYWSQMTSGVTKRFKDGSGDNSWAEVQIHKNSCPNGCDMLSEHSGYVAEFTVKCAGARTKVYHYWYGSWNGGNFLKQDTYVPTSNNRLLCGGQANMQRGYCGCWQSGTLYNTIRGIFNNCHGIRFYDPSNSRGCWGEYFTTRPANSIFAAYEALHTIMNNDNPGTVPVIYDSAQPAISDEAMVNLLGSEDIIGQADPEEVCKDLVNDLTGNGVNWDLAATDAKTYAINEVVKVCIEDVEQNMMWTSEMMKSDLCSNIEAMIHQERVDVYCAYSLLQNSCSPMSTDNEEFVKELAATTTPQQVSELMIENKQIKKLVEEVQKSAEAVGYWEVPVCNTDISDSDDLSGSNCMDYVFKDTASLSCTDDPPVINGKWDGTCSAGSSDGDACSVQCDDGADVFPATSLASVQYTCKMITGETGFSVVWQADNPMRCCTGSCDVYTGQCSQGRYTCQTCQAGFGPNADQTSCVRVDCPANSDNHPSCSCDQGFGGTLTFSDDYKWLGSCTVIDCPENSQLVIDGDERKCACNAGFAGTVSWNVNDQVWSGSCLACQQGVNFAATSNRAQCEACTSCDGGKEVEGTACQTTSDRVCLCKAGYFGTPGQCSPCPQEANRIVTYSDANGLAQCKQCEVCNSETETEETQCTATSDTVCKCKNYGGNKNSNGCGEEVQEETGENKSNMGLEDLIQEMYDVMEVSSLNATPKAEDATLSISNTAAAAGVLMPGL